MHVTRASVYALPHYLHKPRESNRGPFLKSKTHVAKLIPNIKSGHTLKITLFESKYTQYDLSDI